MENPITLEEQRKVWKIHQSVNGITYYYNRSTKKSQYEMPQCFKITQQDLDHPDWKQYRSAEGRKFYYNALTRKSCWHMPPDVKQWKIKIQEQKRKNEEANGGRYQQEKLSQADQIRKKFMTLLKKKTININTKWDVCIQLCEDDDRWNLLKMSDKKRYFNDYITELKKIDEMQKKAKTQANKIQFLRMLKQHKNLVSDCKMHKVQFEFITDPRWRLLQGIDKQNAFQEYMDQLLINEKRQNSKKRQTYIQQLKMLLEQKEIKYNLQWDNFRKIFREQICYKNLHPYDRITTFINYILQAQKKNDENQSKQKRLKERTNRTNYRDMIRGKLFRGQISYKMKWKNFVKQFREDQNLLNMMDPQQQGSSAHEIFQHFMYGIRENHKPLKTEIKSRFKKIGFKMTQQTKQEQFLAKLSDLNIFASQKPVIKEYFYHYFNQKIRSKNLAKQERQKQKEKERLASLKKALKKQKKAIFKIFKQIREHTKTKYSISDHVETIQKNLKEQNILISHENIFKYYLAYLDAEGDDDKNNNIKQSKSRSSSSSKHSQRKSKRKKRDKEGNDESGKKDRQLKAFNIPNILKANEFQQGNDMQQEGEIKDEELDNEKEKTDRHRQKDRKKRRQKKSKKKSSSSDSD